MNRKILILVGIVAIIAAYFLTQSWFSTNEDRVLEDRLVENDEYSLSFNYFAGEDGYQLAGPASDGEVLQSYVLIQQDSFVEFQQGEAETTPPTMSIFVFELPDVEEVEGEDRPGRITRLQNWAVNNQGLTSFDRIYGTPDIIEIDGVKAIQFDTDGTYQQSIYLASYRGYIYMFVGQYERPTDTLRKDFQSLIESVRFE